MISRVKNLLYYPIAALAIAATAVFRSWLEPALGERSQYIFFLPVILLAGLYAGFGPGLLSVAVAVIMGSLLVMPLAETSTQDAFAVTGFVIVSLAILLLTETERREKQRRLDAEAKLEELNLQLEERVEQRTNQLAAATKELEGFCYSVSHDLRTPMRSIAGNARILREDFGEQLDEEMQEKLVRIEAAGTKLGELIEGLLIYARLASQEMSRETVNLSVMVEEAIRMYKRELKCNVSEEIQPDIKVEADAKMMRVAINALVKNAILYREPGEDACVSLREISADGRRVFELSDGGIGFEMEYVDKIWQPFERLHRDEDYLGVGMGLAHVKRILERHGGEISAVSSPADGSTFRFTVGPS